MLSIQLGRGRTQLCMTYGATVKPRPALSSPTNPLSTHQLNRVPCMLDPSYFFIKNYIPICQTFFPIIPIHIDLLMDFCLRNAQTKLQNVGSVIKP